ncbi:MAG: hypothetical protein WA705_26955 [Candidatus Ozemobacteraceae bacterium]
MTNEPSQTDSGFPSKTPVPELSISEYEVLKTEWLSILDMQDANFQEKVLGIFLHTREWMSARSEKRSPCVVAQTVANLRGSPPAGDAMKARLVRAIFIASLETPRQIPKPGVIGMVTAIFRLAFGWGNFHVPSLGREIVAGSVADIPFSFDDGELRGCCEEFLRDRLSNAEWFIRNGCVRGTGALVVACGLLTWYARGAAFINGKNVVGIEQARCARAIVDGFFQESPPPFEKVMHEGYFSIFFDALLGRETLVSSLSRIL